jgi:hypothetical protein
LEAHLEEWTRDVADQRVYGTTGEAPIERFRRAEAGALSPIGGFRRLRWRASWGLRFRLIAISCDWFICDR